VAILLVLLLHGRFLSGGFLGVDLFFVLSGFLISALLLKEWSERGSISLRRFYVRRARRLFPALVLMILGVAVLYLALSGVQHGRGFWPEVAVVAGYAANWVAATASPPGLSVLGLFGHTWSLAIEEQFYIVWPLLFLLLLRRRVPLGWIAALLLAAGATSAILRWLVWARDHSPAPFLRTDTRADGLLLGCATLVLISCAPSLRRRLARSAVVVPALAVLAVAVATLRSDASPLYAGGLVLVEIASAALIAHVVLSPGAFVARALSLRPLTWLGARSYGIYLYHFPIFFCVSPGTVGLHRASFFTVVGPMTVAVSALSYRFVERPLLARTQYPRIADVSRPIPVGSPIPSTPAPTCPARPAGRGRVQLERPDAGRGASPSGSSLTSSLTSREPITRGHDEGNGSVS
jgi:peptidoglycan/LPS O-acetylase OafA/YrhL